MQPANPPPPAPLRGWDPFGLNQLADSGSAQPKETSAASAVERAQRVGSSSVFRA